MGVTARETQGGTGRMAGRLLIFDRRAATRIVLRSKLSAACYEVQTVHTAGELRDAARQTSPDLVIADLDADRDAALEACRALCGQTEATETPVLFFSASTCRSLRRDAYRAGAWAVLDRPMHDGLLMATLRAALRQRRALCDNRQEARGAAELGLMEDTPGFRRPGRIALVASTPEQADQLTLGALRGTRLTSVVMTPDEALSAGDRRAPDVFIVPGSLRRPRDGLGLLSELRSRTGRTETRVIVVFSDPRGTRRCASEKIDDAVRDDAAMALDLGADDVVLPGQTDGLEARVERLLGLKQVADRSRRSLRSGIALAAKDPLTGLYNRRFAQPRLTRMVEVASELRKPLAMMILDLDRFKAINDRFGHATGDAVLVEVARRLTGALRPRDLVARSGGEEFWIALPDTDRPAALRIAQALCTLVRTDPVVTNGLQGPVRVTASIGVAMADGSDPDRVPTVHALLEQADSALYAAKHGGRDTVNLAGCAA